MLRLTNTRSVSLFAASSSGGSAAGRGRKVGARNCEKSGRRKEEKGRSRTKAQGERRQEKSGFTKNQAHWMVAKRVSVVF